MSATSVSAVTTQVIHGFDDPRLDLHRWNDLLHASDTDVATLTWQWQRAWWESFPKDQLLLVTAHRDGETVAIASLVGDEGMVYFAGTGLADYLDFIGDVDDEAILDAILTTARDCVPKFDGFRFGGVPATSRTGERLQGTAARLGLDCYEEERADVPFLDLAAQRDAALAAATKPKLVKRERALCRLGALDVRHFQDGDAILPNLDAFFDQHISRWGTTETPSMFLDQRYRDFVERATRFASGTDWLRFTRVDWDGSPIAFHYGSCYRGRYIFGTPTFAPAMARCSPGTTLLRHVLLAAIAEDARTFDFGPGDEAYKFRFATQVTHVETWGLYPR